MGFLEDQLEPEVIKGLAKKNADEAKQKEGPPEAAGATFKNASALARLKQEAEAAKTETQSMLNDSLQRKKEQRQARVGDVFNRTGKT
jgi:hypothetical protein